LHELGAAYAEVLADHRRTLREAWQRGGGVEVDTQGDAFFGAFARASDAVSAAAAAQAALGGGPVRVRMGLHTGEPQRTDEGYVGLDVHRAARVAAAGHGGQVLFTHATRELIDVELVDLGDHRLKDLSAPERLFQLGTRVFPPLRTLYQTNLPVPATRRSRCSWLAHGPGRRRSRPTSCSTTCASGSRTSRSHSSSQPRVWACSRRRSSSTGSGLVDHLLEVAGRANLWAEAAGETRGELFAAEAGNIDAALGFCLRTGAIEAGLRLTWLIEQHWRSRPADGVRWVDALLAAAPADLDPLLRARAVRVRGGSFEFMGAPVQAREDYDESLELFRSAGDEAGIGHGLHRLSFSALRMGDPDRAERLADESLELDRRAGGTRGEALALGAYGHIALMRGDSDAGLARLTESAELAEAGGLLWWGGVMRLEVTAELLKLGRVAEADAMVRQSAAIVASVSDPINLRYAFAIGAQIAALESDAARAGVLWGALDVVERNAPASMGWPEERAEFEQTLSGVAGEEFEQSARHGRTLDLESAVAALID
jgi:tetratricopeptide (TPR) repeat protein